MLRQQVKTQWEEINASKILQVALWLVTCLFVTLIGVLTVPSRLISRTVGGGAALGGSGVLYLAFRKKRSQSTSLETAPYVFSEERPAVLFLVIALSTTHGASSAHGFLFSIAQNFKTRLKGTTNAWLEEKTDGAPTTLTSYWHLKSGRAQTTARYVEVRIDPTRIAEELSTLSSVVRNLGAQARSTVDFVRSCADGEYPRDSALKGVILSCRANHFTDEPSELAPSAAQSVRRMSKDMRAFFPLYIVCFELEAIAGFREFAMRLPATKLETAWGVSVENCEGPDDIQKSLKCFADALAAMRPAALDREREVLNLQLKVLGVDQEGKEALKATSYKERALIHNFPRKMRSLCQSIAEFTWMVATQHAGPAAGPRLRGIFFTGNLVPVSTETVRLGKDATLVSARDLILHRLMGK